MGLLDEAIREHLELKRRRGADPTEVSRQEHEALGPVRRDPEDAPDAGASADEDAAYADEAGYDQPYAAGNGYEEPPAAYEEPPAAYEARGALPYDAAADLEPLEPEDPEPLAEPAEAGPPTEYLEPPPPAEPPPPGTGRAAEEWGFEEEEEPAPVEEPPAADEDVLEETPEFLQETPEHDRLWFEQKPPRDFDFDG